MAISRRALLAAGGATTAGLGVAGVTAFRLSDSRSPVAEPASAAANASATARPSTTAQPATVPTPAPLSRGGSARRTAFYPLSFDTFDALRTGEISTLEVLGRTHSRLVAWRELPAGGRTGSIAGDLAASWEQPDPAQLVLHLDPKARWQPSGDLAARSVTADDVAQHLRRTLALAGGDGQPSIQRAWTYGTIASVSAPNESTVILQLATPDPFILDTLAGRFALVQRPEAVAAYEGSWQDQVPATAAGSGPWRVIGADDATLVFAANLDGHRAPFLDALQVTGPILRARAADLPQRDEWLVRDRRDTAEVRSALGDGWTEDGVLSDSPVISTFDVGAPPWNDPRLIASLDRALSRSVLGATLFGGRASAASVLPPHFGIEPAVDAPGLGDPDTGATEARRLWLAASGDTLGPLSIDLPGIFDPVYSAGATIAGRLKAVLGLEVRLAGNSYTAISAKAAEHGYGNGHFATWFGWGPPVSEPSAARWLVETYQGDSATALASSYRSDSVDTAIAALASTPPAEWPAAMRSLAAHINADRSGGVVTWMTQRFERFCDGRFRWPDATPFASQHLDTEIVLA